MSTHDLFIDVNKPVSIDDTSLGRWISISWFRKFDSNISNSFYVFDDGVISSIHNKILQVLFEEGGESYDVFLQPNNWINCVLLPPTRQYQWQLLRKKASWIISIIFVCKYFSNLIS